MIICYDLELEKSIQEVGGWGAAIKGKAGISCAAAIDPKSWKSWIFLKDNFTHLVKLLDSADLVVTWNGNRFDDHVLANSGFPAKKAERWDLLQACWSKTGRIKGWTLNETVKRNLPAKKLTQGYEAPFLFQQGRIGELVTYCLRDTWLLASLVNKIDREGYLIGPNQERVGLKIPITKSFSGPLARI